ncbi:MAG: 8-oxo-dGTP diphosphatase [Elusimicrobiales bacterium]|nr:8-oxo-dGTP diphosphatase [Elusimicrobiales bacterium]
MNFMYSNNILATLCYVYDGKRVLMLHRTKKKNDIHAYKYNGLGGKIEKNETPLECVIREVKEESGLKIKKPILKGILRFPNFDGKNCWTVFVYLANIFYGSIKKSDEGELLWINLEKLSKINIWEGDKYFIKYVFKENIFFYGVFYYKKGKLVDFKLKLLKSL